MTVAGITVTDPDSMDAAADALDYRESYDAYVARRADELDAENGWTADDDTSDAAWESAARYDNPKNDGLFLLVTVSPDPEPPTPGAPAVALVAATDPAPCPACDGYGVHKLIPHTAASGKTCWVCNGSGTDEAPAPNVVDRTEHMRRIGQTGGFATYARHGSRHMSLIGKTGFTITAARHGREYALALVKGKGWEPRPQPDLLSDLRAGRELAGLANAA